MHVWGIRASTTDSSCPARTPEKCDANADSKCDLFLRNHKPGRRITIDVISGWRCGSGPHRRPVNLGANSLKWEMSDRDFERAAVSMDESPARSDKGETMKLDSIQHDKEYQRRRLKGQPGCAKEEILEENLAVLQRKPGAAYVPGSGKVL